LLFFFGLAVAGLFLVIVLLSGLVRLLPSWRVNQQLIALPAQLALYAALYLALWVILRFKYDRPLWPSLGWRHSRIPIWQAFIGGCLLSFAIGLLGTALKTPRIHSPFDRFLHSPPWIVMFGLFAVLVGPLFEEMIFRGFVQPLLTRDLGALAGISLTAAVFGLLHGSEYSWAWQYVVLVGMAGACFGWARVWGRSLVPSTFMHAGFNFMFFLAAILQNRIPK
jgi:membrane protease YdiL (CAAX protease family)